MQQTYEGIPVWGADIVVHSSDTTFKSLAGNLTLGLKSFDTIPDVEAGEALFAAKGDYALQGKGMENLAVEFTIRFPEGEDGDKAREALPRAVKMSHDRLCTVSRTVELGTPVTTTANETA